jgi:formate hydrogenlyase subunit 4
MLSPAAGAGAVLLAAGLFTVLLAENCRVPFDDPNTHLELTMIHEVMVLDHSGPDFAFILYGSALKLWLLGTLLVSVVVPLRTGTWWIDIAAASAGMVGLAVLTGLIEASMARVRLVRIPQLLVSVFAAFALVLVLR